jgi:hypothetical protein
MAGKGMGAATRGGGAVEKGPRNRMESNPAKGKTGPVMMKTGGAVSPRKKMAMGMMNGGMVDPRMMPPGGMPPGGMPLQGMKTGGMMKKGYAAGGAAMKKKMMAAGGKRGK